MNSTARQLYYTCSEMGRQLSLRSARVALGCEVCSRDVPYLVYLPYDLDRHEMSRSFGCLKACGLLASSRSEAIGAAARWAFGPQNVMVDVLVMGMRLLLPPDGDSSGGIILVCVGSWNDDDASQMYLCCVTMRSDLLTSCVVDKAVAAVFVTMLRARDCAAGTQCEVPATTKNCAWVSRHGNLRLSGTAANVTKPILLDHICVLPLGLVSGIHVLEGSTQPPMP